jgi:hypothetical protein
MEFGDLVEHIGDSPRQVKILYLADRETLVRQQQHQKSHGPAGGEVLFGVAAVVGGIGEVDNLAVL